MTAWCDRNHRFCPDSGCDSPSGCVWPDIPVPEPITTEVSYRIAAALEQRERRRRFIEGRGEVMPIDESKETR